MKGLRHLFLAFGKFTDLRGTRGLGGLIRFRGTLLRLALFRLTLLGLTLLGLTLFGLTLLACLL